VLIQAHVVKLECPHAPPELSCKQAARAGELQEIKHR
jgi:hypothetical protein